MQIDITKPYEECAEYYEYLTDVSKEALNNAAQALYGDYWDLTCGEFFRLSDGDFSRLKLKDRETVAQHIWLEGFSAFCKELEKILRGLVIPTSMLRPYEVQARNACLKISGKEGILVFLQRYFGLHNFREAETITLAEYIIAKRADYNAEVMRRRCEQLQQQALNKQRKK